jgi:small redox-active disulfide protein 2
VEIKVLGPGCARCQQLMENTRQALEALSKEAEVIKVTDVNQIAQYGVMMTPALVVNGEVKISGKVPSVEEIKSLLNQ